MRSVDAGSGSESHRAGWCWQGASNDLIGHPSQISTCEMIYLSNLIRVWSVHTTTIMVLNPLSTGRGPMKSIATESQWSSGMGRGWSGPIGLVVVDLICW